MSPGASSWAHKGLLTACKGEQDISLAQRVLCVRRKGRVQEAVQRRQGLSVLPFSAPPWSLSRPCAGQARAACFFLAFEVYSVALGCVMTWGVYSRLRLLDEANIIQKDERPLPFDAC
jgi:hypothetical protein